MKTTTFKIFFRREKSQYLELTQEVNEVLKGMADNCDYMYYVDASAWPG